MIIDLNNILNSNTEFKFDVLIVGAGTVGIFAASYIRHLSPKTRIAIIEAGSKTPAKSSNKLKQIGKFHFGIENGRAKGLGGTSSLWGGQLAEFDEIDIRLRQQAWGFSYGELVDYYNKAYDFLGVNFKSQDKDYHRSFIKDLKLNYCSLDYYVTNWLKTPNFSNLFKSHILSENIYIYINAVATDAYFKGPSCDRLEIINEKNLRFKFSARKIIFAGGTLENNQFFLSTGEFGDVPWLRNNNIGKYFQDHLGGNLGTIYLKNEKLFREVFENGWINKNKVQPKIKLNDNNRPLVATSVALSMGYDSNLSENISNVKSTLRGVKSALGYSTLSSLASDIKKISPLLLPIINRYVKNRRILSVYDKKLFLYGQGEQIPLKESKLIIDHTYETQQKLKPLLLDWRVSGDEISSFLLSAVTAKKFFVTNNIGDIEINANLESKSINFINELNDTYHMSGGLLSSDSSNTGVVDTFQKVWGVDNLWILGSATFPSSSHANTTLTALALSIRTIECSIL